MCARRLPTKPLREDFRREGVCAGEPSGFPCAFNKGWIPNFLQKFGILSSLSKILFSTSCGRTDVRPGIIQMVPVTVRVARPGVRVYAPVAGSWVKVAAGTVMTPGTVANWPVVSS